LAKKEIELAKLWNKIPTFAEDSPELKSERFQMLEGSTRIHNKMKEMIKSAQNECKLNFFLANLLTFSCAVLTIERIALDNCKAEYFVGCLNSEIIIPRLSKPLRTLYVSVLGNFKALHTWGEVLEPYLPKYMYTLAWF